MSTCIEDYQFLIQLFAKKVGKLVGVPKDVVMINAKDIWFGYLGAFNKGAEEYGKRGLRISLRDAFMHPKLRFVIWNQIEKDMSEEKKKKNMKEKRKLEEEGIFYSSDSDSGSNSDSDSDSNEENEAETSSEDNESLAKWMNMISPVSCANEQLI